MATGLLINQSGLPVQGVTLRVDLADAQGDLLESSQAQLALDVLGAGATSPFSTTFTSQAGTQVTAEITGYRPASGSPLPIDLALTRRTVSGDGQLAVLGTLANPNPSPIQVTGLAIVGSDADGQLTAMSTSWVGPKSLSPGQETPFLALLPTARDTVHLQGFTAAQALQSLPQPAIDLVDPPVLRTDDQGNVFVLGVLHNPTQSPATARLVVYLIGHQGPASAALYASPIPLSPGEARAFSLTGFPGLAAQLASGVEEAAKLRVQALVDPNDSGPAGRTTTMLRVEITAYESLSGAVLVHGTAYNESQGPVLQPTVIGALRSTSGVIWSAGDVSLGDELPASSQADFVLLMPKPAGVEPSEGEFDIRGLGLKP